MGHTLLAQVFVQSLQIETDVILYNIHGSTGPHAGPKVMLVGIEAVTGVSSIARAGLQTYMLNMEVCEDAEILFAQHHTLRRSCSTAGVKQH